MRLRVPGPGVLQGRWHLLRLKFRDAEAPKDVESTPFKLKSFQDG
jgi:hypothetical protein